MVKFLELLSISVKLLKLRLSLLLVFTAKVIHRFGGLTLPQIHRATTAHSPPNLEFTLMVKLKVTGFMRPSTQKVTHSPRFLQKETFSFKAVVCKTNLETTRMTLLTPGTSGTTTTVLMTGLKETTIHGSVSTTLNPTLSSTSLTRLKLRC